MITWAKPFIIYLPQAANEKLDAKYRDVKGQHL